MSKVKKKRVKKHDPNKRDNVKRFSKLHEMWVAVKM